jgi:hypothetical protein
MSRGARKTNRSGVIERWLRRAARLEASQELEDDTIAYYESLSPAEVAEDAEWARVSSDAFGDRRCRLMLERGRVYWATLPGDKRRPVLVLSPEARNARANDVIVAPLSSTLREGPWHVRLRKGAEV